MNGNHPVAIPYPVGQVANTYNGKTTGGAIVGTEFVTDPTIGNIVLYKDTSGTVTRVTTLASGTANGIECSSCHDPHNSAAVASNDFFLRGTLSGNTSAYICLKCHIK